VDLLASIGSSDRKVVPSIYIEVDKKVVFQKLCYCSRRKWVSKFVIKFLFTCQKFKYY
jgi:hypothetical protein